MSVFPKISTKGNQNSRICRLSQAKEISEGSQSRCIKNVQQTILTSWEQTALMLWGTFQTADHPWLTTFVRPVNTHPVFTLTYAHQDKNGSMPVCFRQAFSGLPSKQYFQGYQVKQYFDGYQVQYFEGYQISSHGELTDKSISLCKFMP